MNIKLLKESLPLVALLAAISFTVLVSETGCTTVTHTDSSGVITTNSVPDPVVLQMVSQEAASVGATLWLANHPADRDKFVLASTSLHILLATGNGTVADLKAAIAALPIQQLQGANGAVVVSGAVLLLDAAGKEVARLDKASIWADFVQPVATGLSWGLDSALGVK